MKPSPDLRARILRRVVRTATGRAVGPCWIWQGAKDRDGYGLISIGGKLHGAHRASFEVHRGRQIPPGASLMHACDTPSCVNPDHLSIGSQRANAADMTAKGRRACKLSAEQVERIRKRRGAGESAASLAEEFGVHPATIRAAVSGRSWR